MRWKVKVPGKGCKAAVEGEERAPSRKDKGPSGGGRRGFSRKAQRENASTDVSR